MATYVTPKRATAFQCFVELRSQANTKIFQVNPTLAAGDVKVSKDGGAFANLTTLPAVAPAGGRSVQVDLSATEMTADNVKVVFSDAAGAEWCDLSLLIQTTARQVDDLLPTASYAAPLDAAGTRTAVGLASANLDTQLTAIDDFLDTEIAAIKAKTDNLPAAPAAVSDIPTAAGVADAVWDEARAGHVGAGSFGEGVILTSAYDAAKTAATQASVNTIDDFLDTEVAGILAAVDTEVGAIKTTTDQLTFTTANKVDARAFTVDDKTGYSIASGGIGSGAHAAAELNALADAFLDRNMATGTDSGANNTTTRTVRQALRRLRNKESIGAGTLTVTKEDDSTTSWTAAVTTTAGDPISAVDPQ